MPCAMDTLLTDHRRYGHNTAECCRSLMLANAQAHAYEYLPVACVETATVTQLHKVQMQYEAASEARQALKDEEHDESDDDETAQQKWDESKAAEASAKAVMEAVWSEVSSVVEQSMRQALADYEEKHGMDHPTTARMAWQLGLQLKGEDKEAMLMRAARALLECPGPAHEMTWTCFRDLYEHLDCAAWADKDNAGIKHRRNSIRHQLLHTMAAGLLAGTSYGYTNVNWEELGYEAGEFGELVDGMLGNFSEGDLMTNEIEVLMEMVQGAERFLGADHVLSGCLLAKLHMMLEQLMMDLKSVGPNLQLQGVSNKDGASSIPTQGNNGGIADEKVEGDDKAADVASDAGSQGDAEALTASAKHAMACKAACLGDDIAARQVKHVSESFGYAPSQDVFQKHLSLLGKPHAR